MDRPDATSPVPPQLDYAPQPSVGDLTLSRRDGVVTIQVRAGWRRIFRAAWSLAFCAIFAMAPLAYLLLMPVRSNEALPFVVLSGFSLLWGIATAIKPLLFTLRGHKWIASATGLEFTGRRLADIVNEVYPRSTIAELCVDRVRLKNRVFKRRGLVIIKPNGGQVLILFGTLAELTFACQSFREALNLPPDPLGESQYPKPPKRSRIKRRLTLDGVALTLFPPQFGITGVFLILLSLAVVAPIDYWIENLNWRLGDRWAFSWLGTARVLVCTGLLAAVLSSGKYWLQKAISLAWTGGFVHLTERSLLNPCAEKWPIDQVDSFIIEPTDRGRSNLKLKLKDNSVTPLIQNQKSREVQLAHDLLNTAMRRQRIPLPIAG